MYGWSQASMNTPGGRPPAKLWRFLALGVINWRSCFWLDFLWTPFCLSKNQRGWSFSTLCLKNKALPLPSTDSRWSTLMFKSKILPIVYVEDIPVKASMPNLVSTLPKDFAGEVVFDCIFWSLWIGNFHDSGLNYGYARICLKYHRGRVEMTFQTELCLCPDISTAKSKILPIVFVEDIPVKALMPNLVQLYQKTLLSLIHLTRTNT